MLKKTSNIEFDSESDHLYLKIQEPRSSDGEELGESGIFLFYGEDEEIVSLEIVGVSTHNVKSISLLKSLLPEAAYDELREFFAEETSNKALYYFDTEFIEDGVTIDLISIGIVCEDGREYYAINKDCDFSKASRWVQDNVIAQLPPKDPIPMQVSPRVWEESRAWKSKKEISKEVAEFFGCQAVASEIKVFPKPGFFNKIAFFIISKVPNYQGRLTSVFQRVSEMRGEHVSWALKRDVSSPEIWAYYADYDHVALCQLFGTMMELPRGFPMYTKDLKQVIDELGSPCFGKQSEGEHNALSDARWVRDTYLYLQQNYEHPALTKTIR